MTGEQADLHAHEHPDDLDYGEEEPERFWIVKAYGVEVKRYTDHFDAMMHEKRLLRSYPDDEVDIEYIGPKTRKEDA